MGRKVLHRPRRPRFPKRSGITYFAGPPFKQKFKQKFNPLSLFANGEQGAWYDPSDLTTLYQDSAGTTPVTTDGDPVGLMLDKSGNGNHATQSTSGAKPIYRTDGTLHWLEFDGFDDFMATWVQVIDGLNYFMTAAASVQSSTNTGALFASSDSAGTSHALYFDGRDSPRRIARVGGGIIDVYLDRPSRLATDTPEVISVQRNTSVATGYINSAEVDSAPTTASAGDVSNFKIGGYASIFGNTSFYGGVVLDREATANERIDTEAYQATKSGVTL